MAMSALGLTTALARRAPPRSQEQLGLSLKVVEIVERLVALQGSPMMKAVDKVAVGNLLQRWHFGVTARVGERTTAGEIAALRQVDGARNLTFQIDHDAPL